MAGSSQWLSTTVQAVRELMRKRLDNESLDEASQRDVEMALEELDVMAEELQGQAARAEIVGRPLPGEPLSCEFSVRAIPLRKSGAAGLCWLVRPA